MNIKFIDVFQTECPNLIRILKILHLLLCGASIVGGKLQTQEEPVREILAKFRKRKNSLLNIDLL